MSLRNMNVHNHWHRQTYFTAPVYICCAPVNISHNHMRPKHPNRTKPSLLKTSKLLSPPPPPDPPTPLPQIISQKNLYAYEDCASVQPYL